MKNVEADYGSGLTMIQEQTILPWRVAAGVVLQGIRIRFGRSLVTMMGIVLGIAFLMSTLTAQLIKEGVHDEDQMRAEVKRMAGFLETEMGPPLNRIIGVIQSAPLNETEVRLLRYLAARGLRPIQWHSLLPGEAAPGLSGVEIIRTPLDSVAREASSVLLMGSETWPEALGVSSGLAHLFEHAEGKVLAFTRPGVQAAAIPGVAAVALARARPPEEAARMQETKRAARFRSNWIVLISLVVTVAGIANAMLMSVTERFREIGTMKCLGALSSFIRWMFFLESGLMGAAGGIAGAILGALFSGAAYGFVYGFGPVLVSMDFARLGLYLLLSVSAGIALSVLAAIYPAGVAAAMVPAHALRSNV